MTNKTIVAAFLLLFVTYSMIASYRALNFFNIQQKILAVPNQILSAGHGQYFNKTITLQHKGDQKGGSIPTCMVFLHIPKSGGRSVASFLKNVTLHVMNFTLQKTYGNDNVDLQVSDLQVNNTLTLGHFTTLLFEEEPSFRQCFTMTVLREPVDRAISAFFYHGHKLDEIDRCLEAATNATKRWHARRNLTKRQYKNDTAASSRVKPRRQDITHKIAGKRRARRHTDVCRSNWQYSNDSTRRLAGSRSIKWNTKAETKFGIPQPDRQHLKVAQMKLLKEFDLVCFTHDLPSCADKVMEAFRLQSRDERLSIGLSRMTASVDPKFKTSSRPDKLDAEDMDKFRKANLLDTKLYDWALQNF